MSGHPTVWVSPAHHLFLGLYGVMAIGAFSTLLDSRRSGPGLAKYAMEAPYRPSSLFGSSCSTADADFFNEPSTMRPRLTAAAAQKDDEGTTPGEGPSNKDNFYDITARGACMNRQAAPVA